ncbi:hypothetical protein MNEG_9721 [Monoraphidium neglectum]|uniref:Tyrosine-protein kinase ephrin type A/B receptor-like domain-containing protein n=1 Tax=Monoraphidium neglectum TaxID=145388 RepID=A0A0D2MBK2_9CHLO|nr:hypothetical protein MNEG_9721 [Monoraphidium neglectum]KIY98241.1 hypothetical protein MNEG_9721 [Monoraphidium neglectum]|eukprot:XP_013897261.1 hypothetical protein MNEG_9721 [Monoraphidium neglectum]
MKGKASFVLLSAAPARCLSSGVAVLWPCINVTLRCDCTLAVGGAGARSNRFPTSGAAVPFPLAAANGSAGATWQTWGYEGGVGTTLGSDVSGEGSSGSAPSFPATFDGLARALARTRLTPLSYGDGGFGSFTAADYAFKRAGGAGFEVASRRDGCKFRYRLAAGAFPSFKPEACVAGSPDCPRTCAPGRTRLKLEGALGSLCAPCPAGTYGPGGAAAPPCKPCPAGAVAPRAGADRCEACGARLAASQAATACVPCFDAKETSSTTRGGWYTALDFASQEGFNRFAAFPAASGAPGCSFRACPLASLPDALGYCISSEPGSGRLCVADAAPGAPPLARGEACGEWKTPHDGEAPAAGGAALRLLGGAVGPSGGACAAPGVKALAAKLANQMTWAGFQYRFRGTPIDSGVFWEVLGGGDLGGLLGQPSPCTGSRAGPGVRPELTLAGQPLGE